MSARCQRKMFWSSVYTRAVSQSEIPLRKRYVRILSHIDAHPFFLLETLQVAHNSLFRSGGHGEERGVSRDPLSRVVVGLLRRREVQRSLAGRAGETRMHATSTRVSGGFKCRGR